MTGMRAKAISNNNNNNNANKKKRLSDAVLLIFHTIHVIRLHSILPIYCAYNFSTDRYI